MTLDDAISEAGPGVVVNGIGGSRNVKLNWFKPRPEGQRPHQTAEEKADFVLQLLAKAAKEIPSDGPLSPERNTKILYRAVLNTFLGKGGDARFDAVQFGALVARVSETEGAGALSEVIATVGANPVLMPLLLAALHQVNETVGNVEIRQRAELLLAELGGA